jgi:hypothetical protein
MRALGRSVAWLLGGGALAGGLFWAFLHTPESTVFTLATSLVLVVAIVLVMGATLGAALEAWVVPQPSATARRSWRSVAGFVLAALVTAGAWWAVGSAQAWLTLHVGEIGAWFIATFDRADVRPLVDGVRLAGDWVRTVVVPFGALTWLGQLARDGRTARVDGPVVRHALSPWRLAMVTAVAALTLWAPLAYGLFWRPAWLPPPPPYWVEPAFAIAKFSTIAVVGAVGLSLIARMAIIAPPSTPSPR